MHNVILAHSINGIPPNRSILRSIESLWGEPPITGRFPIQMTVNRGFDVFFVVLLNKQLSKQSTLFTAAEVLVPNNDGIICKKTSQVSVVDIIDYFTIISSFENINADKWPHMDKQCPTKVNPATLNSIIPGRYGSNFIGICFKLIIHSWEMLSCESRITSPIIGHHCFR